LIRDYDTQGVWFAFLEPVHNVYLLIGAEMGLVGLALFVLLLALTSWEAWRAAALAQDRFFSAFAIGIIGGLTVIAWSNVADVHLRTEAMYAFFWILIGLVMGLRRIQQDIYYPDTRGTGARPDTTNSRTSTAPAARPLAVPNNGYRPSLNKM
jgi:O-antigen ligase